MKTFETLEQALKTKKAEIIKIENYEHKGQMRKSIKAKKAKGKKVFTVIQYENSMFSEAV